MGPVYAVDDDSDRALHGPVDAARRPGKVAEATGIGIVLLLLRSSAASGCRSTPSGRPAFTWSGTSLSWAVMVYGFIASVLPVWLLLAPRDYLSAFMKVGTIMNADR